MKKFFISTLIAMAAFSLFAATQYDIETDGVKVNENMSLMIHVTDNSLFKNYDTFGVTIKNPDGTITTQTFSTADASGKKFDVGNVVAGSEVTFFTGKGGTVYEYVSLTEKNPALTYLVVNAGSGSVTFKIQIAGGEYTGQPAGPAGQPLPGVFAALLLGGGAAGTAIFKRRRKAAAAQQQ